MHIRTYIPTIQTKYLECDNFHGVDHFVLWITKPKYEIVKLSRLNFVVMYLRIHTSVKIYPHHINIG